MLQLVRRRSVGCVATLSHRRFVVRRLCDLPPLTTTKSGLMYRDVPPLPPSDVPEAMPGSPVAVHYTGRLEDGTVFASAVGAAAWHERTTGCSHQQAPKVRPPAFSCIQSHNNMMAGRLSLQWRQTMTFLIRALVMRDYIPNFRCLPKLLQAKKQAVTGRQSIECSLQLPWT